MTDKRFGECLKKLYFDRDPKSNKGDFGRALLIGGSSSYPGAIVIASKLAEVSGDGYTGIRVPDDIFPIVASKVTPLDVFEHFYIEDITPVLKYDSLLFGNGMEVSSLNYELLKKIVSVYQGKMIIDGSGLSILAKYGDGFLQNTGSRILLTPHLKE
ncbi:MAG: NAD(P)H-hydrate dehydratase, partial [Bacilli bacterium]